MNHEQESSCVHAEEYVNHLIIDPKHLKLIVKIAHKYTKGSSVSGEDAAQAGIMKVYEAVNAGKFHHGRIEEFQRWATVVARYEIINLVRRERLRNHQSLDVIIAGTDICLVDTIADNLNLWDAVERADLIIEAKQAILNLDLRYSDRDYLKLWQLMVEGKTQTQIASVLGISQGEVSKRWQELVGRVAMELGLLQPQAVKQAQQNIKLRHTRRRSKAKW
ncbi:MAG: sigma-70 family RNA polymerase sigma factor [Cyanosarcina radialis HA8281-LM2]|jgi:RNA polymerase sporulation-specific sigma factor|nr:sigma-70 family RNA polymerase sigma factor [Cyanosarcina radialis HA8281-LM2]